MKGKKQKIVKISSSFKNRGKIIKLLGND